jgi:hypothetical protein
MNWVLFADDSQIPDYDGLKELLERLDAKVIADAPNILLIECPDGRAETMPEFHTSEVSIPYSWTIFPVVISSHGTS